MNCHGALQKYFNMKTLTSYKLLYVHIFLTKTSNLAIATS